MNAYIKNFEFFLNFWCRPYFVFIFKKHFKFIDYLDGYTWFVQIFHCRFGIVLNIFFCLKLNPTNAYLSKTLDHAAHHEGIRAEPSEERKAEGKDGGHEDSSTKDVFASERISQHAGWYVSDDVTHIHWLDDIMLHVLVPVKLCLWKQWQSYR